ncbi:hypothetical protein JOE11_000895 [Robbsia andropogonis]|uniref:hypothetical protein n=1 Tax=Robbsia andropogonis TaxID=28092 RepID=UPI003D1DCA7B
MTARGMEREAYARLADRAQAPMAPMTHKARIARACASVHALFGGYVRHAPLVLGLSLGLGMGGCALIAQWKASSTAAPLSGPDQPRSSGTVSMTVPANAASRPATPTSTVVDMRPVPSDLRVITVGSDRRVASVAAGTAVDNEAAQNPASPNDQSVNNTAATPAPRVRTIDPDTLRLALALATGPTKVRALQPGTDGDSRPGTVSANDANGWQLQAVIALTRPEAATRLARNEAGWLRSWQLLPLHGCPAPDQLYVHADITAAATDSARHAADAMAPGCGVPVHRQNDLGRPDPLFDSMGSRACLIDATALRRDVRSGPGARLIQGKTTAEGVVAFALNDEGPLLRASPYLTARRGTLAMRQVLGALTQQRFGVTVPWTYASTQSRVYWISGDGSMFDAVTSMLDGATTAPRAIRHAGQPAQWLFSLWRDPADQHYYVRVNAVDTPTPVMKGRSGNRGALPTSTAFTLANSSALRLRDCDASDANGACGLEDFQRTISKRLATDCTRLAP